MSSAEALCRVLRGVGRTAFALDPDSLYTVCRSGTFVRLDLGGTCRVGRVVHAGADADADASTVPLASHTGQGKSSTERFLAALDVAALKLWLRHCDEHSGEVVALRTLPSRGLAETEAYLDVHGFDTQHRTVGVRGGRCIVTYQVVPADAADSPPPVMLTFALPQTPWLGGGFGPPGTTSPLIDARQWRDLADTYVRRIIASGRAGQRDAQVRWLEQAIAAVTEARAFVPHSLDRVPPAAFFAGGPPARFESIRYRRDLLDETLRGWQGMLERWQVTQRRLQRRIVARR